MLKERNQLSIYSQLCYFQLHYQLEKFMVNQTIFYIPVK